MTTNSNANTTIDPATVRDWIASWDAQQSSFFSHREERFAVVVDVLEVVLTRSEPLVVDLGCGPGSLARRIHDRLPEARVVGVDMDPLLLGLARAAHGDWLRVEQLDLRDPEWLAHLDLDRAPDAVVSSTALHWIDREPLEQLIASAAAGLAEGGVIIDADHIHDGRGGLEDLETEVGRRAVARGGEEDALGWADWWSAVEAAPELAGLVAERGRVDLTHAVPDVARLDSYLRAMRRGGCTRAGTVWQVGDDRVVVGCR